MKRLITAITTVTLAGALAWSALEAPLSMNEVRFAAQGYETQTPTPGPSPTPTPTPRPFHLTPRPTSTGLAPRPATPTPRPVAATPGPCTVAIGERSAACKTRYMQPVTWTLRVTTTIADQRVVTSSLFDATSRVVFTPALAGGSIITIAPRWQAARSIGIITLTGQISGSNWTTGTTLTGHAPPNTTVTLIHHKWTTATNSYRATFYTATTTPQGTWTFTPGTILTHPRDYWQIRHSSTAGVTHIAGILTRRFYFVVVRR